MDTHPVPAAAAVPATIDFFGYYLDRSAVAPHVAAAVQSAQARVAAEPDLLDRIDELMLGTGKLRDFLSGLAGRFGQALSLASPGVLEDLVPLALPDDTIERDEGDLLRFGLRPVAYFFNRDVLFPRRGNRVSQIEVRYLRLLPRLANLDWGLTGAGDGPLRKRLQQLRIYFVEFFHGRFKDRNGVRFGPDGGTIDPFQVTPQLAGQMVRVLAEFAGDAAWRVPAATAGGVDPDPSFACAKAGVVTAAIRDVRLDGDPLKADYADLVAAAVRYAAKAADSSVRSHLGALIRGGGIAGINNEAVAEAITAALGGLAKKAAEHVAHETLTRFVTTPSGNPLLKEKTLAVLDYLHHNGPKPPDFPPA